MRIGEGVEWAIHCATILAFVPDGSCLPGARLAEFHGVPPAYLAKALQAMAHAGIVESVPGRHGGYRLARTAAEITLLDIVVAVEGGELAFRCSEIRRRGPASVPSRDYTPVCAIAAAMWKAEDAWRAELRRTSLADLLITLSHTIPPKSASKGLAWMQEVLS